MTLNTIMSQASTGLMAAQTGLRAVSDNISNVNTKGYVRKVVEQTPLVSAGMGVGVDIAAVRRAADSFLQKAALTANASAAHAGVTSDMLGRAQALFGDPSTASSFFGRLDQIYAAFSAAVDDPASTVRRAESIDEVQDFLNEAVRIGASMKAMGAEADSRVAANVDRANLLLQQIDALNADITRAQIDGRDATGSENIQAQLIDELGTLLDININQRPQGGVIVRASDGLMLAGEGPATLRYVRDDGASGEILVTLANTAGSQSLRTQSGEIRALLDLRDRELPGIGEQLAELVTKAADEINRAHNAGSSVPPPVTLTGRNTGLDLPTAVSGFTGRTTVAIVGADGMLQRQVAIDFGAGTMSVDGGPASAFAPGSFQASLDAALGTFGSASFANGALTLSANGGAGVAIADDAANPSMKAGKGFSHFFGMNDLIAADGPAFYETGLRATDPHGFTAGDTVTFRVAGDGGSRIRDIAVAVPPGGTVQDLLNSLNANVTGLGLYGQFSLDAKGAMSFTPNAGAPFSLTVLDDDTQRGPGGPSVSELFGLGAAQRSARAEKFSVRSDIVRDPMKLAFASLDLAQAAAGRPALAIGDGRGAVRLAGSGETSTGFAAAGGLSSLSMTVSRYAAEFGGTLGRKADAAASRQATAEAVAAEANNRRSSVEGVNLDQELISLTTYQQAFNASARLIQATRDMYDILMGMMG